MLDGATKTIEVQRNGTIELVKCKMMLFSFIPVQEQTLIFAGKLLNNRQTVLDYKIQDKSTVHLLLRLRGGKPVIRLHSGNGEIISNVNVRLDLAVNVWNLSSIYPTPSNSDRTSFIEWNNIQVHRDGHILLLNKKQQSENVNRLYPSITDEHEHRMLFWEALTNDNSSIFTLNNGLCVPRCDFSRVLNYLLKNMSFSSEDRDDMITYIIPQLDQIDPEYEKKNIVFRFLSCQEYSAVASLDIQPLPERIVRAFLLYRFGSDDEQVSNIEDIDDVVKLVTITHASTSNLIVYEWGSMFFY